MQFYIELIAIILSCEGKYGQKQFKQVVCQ